MHKKDFNYEKHLYVNLSVIHGVGVFTPIAILPQRQILFVGDLEEKKAGVANWITRLGSKVNHQVNCNCEVYLDDNKFYMRSIKYINEHDELTADYSKLSEHFKRDITGYKEL